MKLAFVAAGSLLSLFTVSSAVAQEARDEIVVTATKREKSLDRSAGSIAAVTSQTLEDRSISGIDEVFSAVANVQFDNFTLAGPSMTVRGVTNNSNGVGFEPGFPVFVDEVYLPRPVSFAGVLYDIDRVEVLRGPQGTTFGKNAVGGLINVVTNRPTQEFDWSADLTVGERDLVQTRGMINGPLAKGVSVRVTAAQSEQEGWLKNRTPGSRPLYGQDFSGLRTQMLLEPTANLSVLLVADHSEITGTGDQHTDLDGKPRDRITTVGDAGGFERQETGFSGRVDYDLSQWTLTSLTALRTSESVARFDQDFSAAPGVLTTFPEDSDIFTQEFRAASQFDGPFNVLFGAFYQRLDTQNAIVAAFGNDRGPGAALVDTEVETTSLAFFTSADWKLSDRFTLSGGLRYTDEDKDYDFLTRTTAAPFPVGSQGGKTSISDSDVSGDVSLSYQASETTFLYGRYARGFKGAGFDNVSAFQSGALTTIGSAGVVPFDIKQFVFDAETVDNYEAGFRFASADRRWRLSMAAFMMDYTDKQEQVTRSAVLGGITVPLATTTNAAEVDISGVETEFSGVLTPWWVIDGSIGYLKTEYKSFVNPNGGANFTGNELPRSPTWDVSLASTFTVDIPGGLEGSFRAEGNHRSENFLASNNSRASIQDAHTLVNLRAGVEASAKGWGVFVFGKNITDEDVYLATNAGAGVPIPPSLWGVELRVRK